MSDDDQQAFESIKAIEVFLATTGLEKTDPALSAAYKTLIAQLKWVGLIYLSEEEVEDLFKNNIGEVFSMEDFDLWEKFRSYLVAVVFVHANRDVFKEKIKNILNKCQVALTSQRLNNGAAPTAENWIKDYVSAVGIGSVDSAKFNSYFLDGKNINGLKPEEKERMRTFFKFYERLKLSTFSVVGVEETIPVPIDDKGTMGVIRDGKVERDTPLSPEMQKILAVAKEVVHGIPATQAVPETNQSRTNAVKPSIAEDAKIADLKHTAAKYRPGSLQRKAVEAEIKKLSKK